VLAPGAMGSRLFATQFGKAVTVALCHCRSVQVLRAADNPNKMRIAPQVPMCQDARRWNFEKKISR
jgi:hypothetical protein